MLVTRFAPSPTGPLHLGHAYAALVAHDMARAGGGRFLLRIEDIDGQRSRPGWEAAILDDLHWLGLTPDAAPLRQSDRRPAYLAALDRLAAMGLLYPCRCSRQDIRAALSAPQEGAMPLGPDGLVYPGVCRGRALAGAGPGDALRLDMAAAMRVAGTVRFAETGPLHAGHYAYDAAFMTATVGDVVLSRRGIGPAYHLAVVVDDAAQGITHVTRGADLFEATAIHALLIRLLGLPQPVWHHHRLIRDAAGTRLAKRDDARALSKFRAEGASPADIRRRIGVDEA